MTVPCLPLFTPVYPLFTPCLPLFTRDVWIRVELDYRDPNTGKLIHKEDKKEVPELKGKAHLKLPEAPTPPDVKFQMRPAGVIKHREGWVQ